MRHWSTAVKLTRQALPANLRRMTMGVQGASSTVEPKAFPLRLPVPPLDQTLAKFLRSTKPLLTLEEFEITKTAVSKFQNEEGPKLQGLLESRAKERANWLEEWWLNTAYLEYRDPVVLFSSPALAWPPSNFKNEMEQLQYAATVISAGLAFNSVLERRAVPLEKSGSDPLDMEQYYKVFGTSRIPLCLRDGLQFQDPQSPPNHIVVMINNNAFKIRVLDSSRNPLPTNLILGSLVQAVKQSKVPGVPIGVLSTDNRDQWARAYAVLCRNVTNLKSINEIERALFVLCLDKPLPRTNDNGLESHTSELLLHGGGFSHGNAANRWCDKTIQFVVGAGADGSGIAYEHSPAEGNPIGVLADYVIEKLKKLEPIQPTSKCPEPVKLNFEVGPEIESAIIQSGRRVDRLAADLDVCGFKFDSFGKNELKALKTSPDSFIQIAIQYAFYKIHGKPAAQYESGSLRRYIGGRTDVIRTCSEESLAFCRQNGQPAAARGAALLSALNAHKSYVVDVMNCRGVDRHLLGLKLIAKENGLNVPALFSDKGYTASTYFQLSTSNVPAKNDAFMVYAPLVHDGYACCYNPRDADFNFGTSAWKTSSYTDVRKFREALKEALLDMRDVLVAAKATKAKL